MIGPPGADKSMLASRLPGLLPPLEPEEALEVSLIASVARQLLNGRLTRRRPFRDPHHSISMPAMVGGGLRAKPGEVSLAHSLAPIRWMTQDSRSARSAVDGSGKGSPAS
jgi:magnesium chelatase family protein